MEIIVLVSFCAIILASNFLNAAPNHSDEKYLLVNSDEHPLLPCRCLTRHCTEEDAFKAMVQIEADGKCTSAIECKHGGFCECMDKRCYKYRGMHGRMFEVKLNEYPGIVCRCIAKVCRNEDGLKMIRRISVKNIHSFEGPCKSNGYCKCQKYLPTLV